MSSREKLQNRLADWINQWQTAPYGVITSVRMRMDGPGKYRSITFGLARTLDAELRIWSENHLELKSSRQGDIIKFTSEDEFKDYCRKEFGAK